ncbi:hypothetical protein CVS40_1690 [Lucilia cuprina]|nr:hypothetical protein CVS40_1690 [Lucilia cuprina]
MNQDIENFILKCGKCQEIGASMAKEPIIPHEIPNLPFEKIGCDILEYSGKNFLVVVDYYSKWFELIYLKSKTSSDVINAWIEVFSRFGIPKVIIADNMPFASFECIEFSNRWNFKIITSSPNYPRSNGLAERIVGVAKKILKTSETKEKVYNALLKYRNTPVKDLNYSPAQLLLHRRLRTKIPITDKLLEHNSKYMNNKIIREEMENKVKNLEKYYNRKTKKRNDFKIGDKIFFKIDSSKKWIPGIIINYHNTPRSYIIKSLIDERIYRRNSYHIKIRKSYDNIINENHKNNNDTNTVNLRRNKTIKQKQKFINLNTPLHEALTLLTEFATFASLLQPLLLAVVVVVLINIIISFNGFSRLTVLMNDFRLKTFYCKSSKSSKSNKTIKKSSTKLVSKTFSTTLTSAATIKLKLSSTLTTTNTNSSSFTPTSAAAAFATSATLLKVKSSKNNNHNRTYNNSSKSNKVFLYYTPRDPRLRILIKTKHFSKRPQQQQQQSQIYNISCCNNKSLFKVLSDLCNYGELIGGQTNSGVNKTIVKQLTNNKNNNNHNKANLNKTKEICDNLIKTSDNLIVATAASAAIETSSADVLIVILTVVAVISEYTKELFKFIEILLRHFRTSRVLKAIASYSTNHWRPDCLTSEMQKHLFTATQWSGQSVRDSDTELKTVEA